MKCSFIIPDENNHELYIFFSRKSTDLESRFVLAYRICFSGYLIKETAVVSIALPFVYHEPAHYAVYLKNSHLKKRKTFLDGQ